MFTKKYFEEANFTHEKDWLDYRQQRWEHQKRRIGGGMTKKDKRAIKTYFFTGDIADLRKTNFYCFSHLLKWSPVNSLEHYQALVEELFIEFTVNCAEQDKAFNKDPQTSLISNLSTNALTYNHFPTPLALEVFKWVYGDSFNSKHRICLKNIDLDIETKHNPYSLMFDFTNNYTYSFFHELEINMGLDYAYQDDTFWEYYLSLVPYVNDLVFDLSYEQDRDKKAQPGDVLIQLYQGVFRHFFLVLVAKDIELDEVNYEEVNCQNPEMVRRLQKLWFEERDMPESFWNFIEFLKKEKNNVFPDYYD